MSEQQTEGEHDQRSEQEDLARACHDINSSLAAVVSCLEYLAAETSGEMHEAVRDAFAAARRIEGIAARLRARYARTPPRTA